MIIRELVTKLGFQADDAKVKAFGAAVNGLIGGLAGLVVGATAAAAGALALAKHVSDIGDELGETSAILGITTERLQVFRFAAERSGTGVDTLNASLKIGQKNLLDNMTQLNATGKALAFLGINVKDSSGNLRTIGDLLPEIADSIKGVGNEAVRAGLLTDIFGRSGGQMALLLKDGSAGIELFGDRLKHVGGIMSDDMIAAAGAFDDAMIDFGATMQGLSFIIGGRLMPIFTELTLILIELLAPTGKLAQQDLDKTFEELASIVADLTEAAVGLWGIVAGLVDAMGGWHSVVKMLKVALTLLAASKVIGWVEALIPIIGMATAALWAFLVPALMNPFVWIPLALIAIGLLVAEIYKATQGADNWVSRMAKGIKSKVMELFNWIGASFSAMAASLWANMPDWMKRVVNGTIGALSFNGTAGFTAPLGPTAYGVKSGNTAHGTVNNNMVFNNANPNTVQRAVAIGTGQAFRPGGMLDMVGAAMP